MRLLALALIAILSLPLLAQLPYDIGQPTLQEVWVDGANGNDANSGSSRGAALRTLTEAWNRIPQGTPLTGSGYRILLTAGSYAESAIPNYLESRYGTFQAPIIITSADGSRTARLLGDLNIFDTRYLYLIGLDMRPSPAGDVYHCEKCDHILIRDSNLDGGAREAHDMTKINQSQYVYLENSTFAGAEDNAIDLVAVQYGHILRNKISNAQDWCAYAKGGSAYLRVEGNEFFNCGTGGFTAGQGTGFQFMTSPWIHYEAYDIKVVNNVIHDTEGAGLGVNGGYNILLAHNTLYRVGTRDHMIEVTFGNRSCDGNPGDPGREACQAYLSAGGWGTTVVDDGSNYVRIPTRNVYIYNNILYNPRGMQSPQVFAVPDAWSGSTQNGSGVDVPTVADENLLIRGNIIFNSGAPLFGEESGCRSTNVICNETGIRQGNSIDAFEPELGADLRPFAGSNVVLRGGWTIPPFDWNDRPFNPREPAGNSSNTVTLDRDRNQRPTPTTPGAYELGAQAQVPGRRRAARP
jgi:hypothetical protein